MKIICEHEIAMPLAGSPRWWTIEIGDPQKRWECVRADYVDSPKMDWSKLPTSVRVDDVGISFLFLPPGSFAWPPLAASGLQLGQAFMDDLTAKGGKWVPYGTKLGKRLELKLMGWKGATRIWP